MTNSAIGSKELHNDVPAIWNSNGTLRTPTGGSVTIGGGGSGNADVILIPSTELSATLDNTAIFDSYISALTDGQTLQLPAGNWLGDLVFTKSNIRIFGAGKPIKSGTVLAGGTIIRGRVFCIDATNVELAYFGLDQTTLASGVINGFQGGTTGADTTDLALYIHDCVTLGRGYLESHGYADVNSQHAYLVQCGKNVRIERCHAYYYGHGYAIRVSDYVGMDNYCEDTELDAVIFKSDVSGTPNNCLRAVETNATAISTDSTKYVTKFLVQALNSKYKTQDGSFINCVSVNSKQNAFETNTTFPTTCTISVASPTIVTQVGHNKQAGDPVRMFSSGVLPTGINSSLEYSVVVIDANSYKLAVNGVEANVTAAGSGTHYASNGVLDTVKFVNCSAYGVAADRSFGLNYGANIQVVNCTDAGHTAGAHFAYYAGATNGAHNVTLIGQTDVTAVTNQATGPFKFAVLNGVMMSLTSTGVIQSTTRVMAASMSAASQGGASFGADGAGSFGGGVRIYKTAGGGISSGYAGRWCIESASSTNVKVKWEASFTNKAYGTEVTADFTKMGMEVEADSTNGGRVGVSNGGAVTHKARLSLPANLATAGYGQLGFDTTGALLTTPVLGVIEAVGDVLYYTTSAGRKTITMV